MMIMQERAALVATILVLAGVGLSPAAGAQETERKRSEDKMSMVEKWPKASREAVDFMTKKYGPPAAVTAEMAVWGKTGPWKRTIVFATEYEHHFPAHHTDVMQQWIDYKAPASSYDELALYDGSVVLERTSGEMSARCDMEGANFLALNLAHDIVNGKKSVEEARKMYGEQIMAMKAMKSAPYTEKLLFDVRGNTGDPDKPLPGMK
ncbi:MAG: hypothetical protein ACT4OZ_07075 [Gemmatimonadota bacterium]